MGTDVTGTRTAIVDAVAAVAPLAFVYFSGWAYLSAYLGDFDIDATQVNISIATVLVYAFVPIWTLKVLGTIAALALVYLLTVLWRPLVKPARRAAPVMLLVGSVVLLFAVKESGGAEAYRMARLVWQGQKSISNMVVKLPDKPDPTYDAYKSCKDSRRLRQILGTNDTMYVLCRNEHLPCWHAILYAIRSDGTITYSAERRRQENGTMESCKA